VISGEQEIARRQRKLGDLLARRARDVLAVVKAYPTAEENKASASVEEQVVGPVLLTLCEDLAPRAMMLSPIS
jgi:hypothetical protein